MPKLKSVRRERFAVEIASMTPYASAYVASGYADSPWAAYNASKLAHIPEVAARIDELQTEYRARSGIKLEYLQAQLLKVIEARPHVDPARAHEVATKITLDAEGNQRVEVDRAAALAMLLKTLGAFSDGVNVSTTAIAGAAPRALMPREVGAAVQDLLAQAEARLNLTSEGSDLDRMQRLLVASGGIMQPEIYEALCAADDQSSQHEIDSNA